MEKTPFTPTDSIEDARSQIAFVGEVIARRGKSNLIRFGGISVLLIALGLMLVVTRAMPSVLIPVVALITAVPIQLANVSRSVLERGRLMSDLSIVSGYSDDQVIDFVNLYARGAGSPPYETRATYDLASETEAVIAIIDDRIAHYTKLRHGFWIATVLLAMFAFLTLNAMIKWVNMGSPSLARVMLLLVIPCTPIFTLMFASSAAKVIKELRKQRTAVERGNYTAQQLFVTKQRYGLDGKIAFVVGPRQ